MKSVRENRNSNNINYPKNEPSPQGEKNPLSINTFLPMEDVHQPKLKPKTKKHLHDPQFNSLRDTAVKLNLSAHMFFSLFLFILLSRIEIIPTNLLHKNKTFFQIHSIKKLTLPIRNPFCVESKQKSNCTIKHGYRF